MQGDAGFEMIRKSIGSGTGLSMGLPDLPSDDYNFWKLFEFAMVFRTKIRFYLPIDLFLDKCLNLMAFFVTLLEFSV